jgi:ribosomal protein S18 acetylase RimI-like enzyme
MLDHADNVSRSLDTLVAAFAEDPIERWLWPDAEEYARHYAEFAECFARNARTAGTAWRLDDYSAVAIWMPPGVVPDAEQIGALLRTTVAPEKHEDMFAVLAQMDQAHPRHPHWYLPWIGVRPSDQGLGVGGRLMAAALTHVDQSQLPVFVEAPNPQNVPFFQQFGFEVIGETTGGSCPPLTFMLRDGRAAQEPVTAS